MKIIIRGEKTKITASMKAYAEEKMQKLDKYLVRYILVRTNSISETLGIVDKQLITRYFLP